MQFPPDAATLLDAVAALLDDDVLPAVPAELQHRVRVAGHLARLLAREQRLGPAAAERERAALLALTGGDSSAPAAELAATVAARLRHEDDPAALVAAWTALVAIARDDVAIAKPGHDAWDGE